MRKFIGKHVVHTATLLSLNDGKWTDTKDQRDVILMAVVGNWAMVRRPRCAPYVVDVKTLSEPSTKVDRLKHFTETDGKE